ncbi:MAG: hypothetical protein V3W31_09890 [Thermodesulfobacteriota bacterium]
MSLVNMQVCRRRKAAAFGFTGHALLVVTVSFLCYGCATTGRPLKSDEIDQVKNAAVLWAVHYPRARFEARTPGKTAILGGGAMGALLNIEAGKSGGEKMWEAYSLQDPAVVIKNQFLSGLTRQLRAGNFRTVSDVQDSDRVDDLKASFETGMVVDFKTTRLLLFYYPTDWSHYRLAYQARARLIRIEDSKIVWQGGCKVVGDDPTTSPTFEELQANGGKRLKEMLVEAGNACSEQLLAQAIGSK